MFLSSYQKLGAESRAVIDAMVDGVSAQVLAEQLGKKMSTVYSYRRDIYGKVGIQGENKLQQLRDNLRVHPGIFRKKNPSAAKIIRL